MKKGKAIAAVWLAGAVLVGTMDLQGHTDGFRSPASYTVYAANEDSEDLQGQLDAAEKKRDELESEQSKLEKEIDHIQSATGDIKEYIESLDYQLIHLDARIETNEKEIEGIEEEVEAINEELELAQEKQQTQYEGMKARIQYMYENSNSSYLQYLLESRSLADLFSREEYIDKITNYDGSLLSQYQAILTEVTVAQHDAEKKLEAMEVTKETLAYEKKTLKRLMKEKNRQVKIFQGQIQDSKQEVNDYAQQIQGQEEEIEALLQKQRANIASQESSSGKAQVVATTGDYAWPLTIRGRISSPFGYRSAPTAGASTYHKGVDIAASSGSPILATKDGKVVTATYSASAGNYIAIYHGSGTYSYYMHCSKLNVSSGDRVKKGQVIGEVGSTGISTGSHLHFAIYKGGNYVNPMYYVSQP